MNKIANAKVQIKKQDFYCFFIMKLFKVSAIELQ